MQERQESWSKDVFGWREFCSIRVQWRHLLLAWLWMQFGSYIDALGMASVQNTHTYYLAGKIWRPMPPAVLQDRLPDGEWQIAQQSVILLDRGHIFLPWVDPKWCNVCTITASVLFYLRFIIFPGPRSMRWTILRRLWVLVGLVRVVRGITIQGTVLPNPDLDCVPVVRSDNAAVEAFWLLTLLDVTCQDVLYSEHTCVVVMFGLFWAFYAPGIPLSGTDGRRFRSWSPVIIPICVTLLVLLSLCIIIGSRFHYTDDVLLATFACTLSFAAWHGTIRAAPFHNGRFWRSIVAFESESVDMREWLSWKCSCGVNSGLTSDALA
eukprot:TRINITY_DN61691_c0_g1_i1.p1 TRINITY_DN61691_c0_g1~~TRINITY_DN61691_c0_g1_i1.p1  ORF type:complete len:322 (+),score=25.62 TRINITY_DN61691_c0_g1_i1:118-1083(+)